MASENNYGDRFESIIIIAMASTIIAAFIGVVLLHRATHEDCTSAKYTYCEPAANEHHK